MVINKGMKFIFGKNNTETVVNQVIKVLSIQSVSHTLVIVLWMTDKNKANLAVTINFS